MKMKLIRSLLHSFVFLLAMTALTFASGGGWGSSSGSSGKSSTANSTDKEDNAPKSLLDEDGCQKDFSFNDDTGECEKNESENDS